MSDDLFSIAPLDQPIKYENSEKLLNRVETVINYSVENSDVEIALGLLRELAGVGRASGICLAKALYMLDQKWDSFGVDDNMQDVIYESVGLHKDTVSRYIQVWKLLVSNVIPEQLVEEIKNRNIKDLIPISKAVGQGFEINDEKWEELADAPDFSTVSKIVREIKGKEPRKGSLQIFLARDGTLNAIRNGETEYVGFLFVDSDSEIVISAIKRIVDNSGIMKQ